MCRYFRKVRGVRFYAPLCERKTATSTGQTILVRQLSTSKLSLLVPHVKCER